MINLIFFALQGLVNSGPLPKTCSAEDVKNAAATGCKSTTLQTGLNITFAIIGAFAVVWIVLSGMRLVFARDNPENITKNRNAIIYAVIGLVIVASAAFIVNIIIGGLGK